MPLRFSGKAHCFRLCGRRLHDVRGMRPHEVMCRVHCAMCRCTGVQQIAAVLAFVFGTSRSASHSNGGLQQSPASRIWLRVNVTRRAPFLTQWGAVPMSRGLVGNSHERGVASSQGLQGSGRPSCGACLPTDQLTRALHARVAPSPGGFPTRATCLLWLSVQ